jgi:4-hydroxybenzoate polyprenyltransferase
MSQLALMASPPPHGGNAGGIELLIFFAAITLMAVLALGSVIYNVTSLCKHEAKRTTFFKVNFAISILLGIAFFLGGFVFHQNAPHDQNWYFLLGGLLVIAVAIAARRRTSKVARPE